ncbi:MAG: hypothetical protein US54_C0004G0017 [Candidatus Roizmanbacteria bacterium GW2011_GWA2_37_7]|uniref:Type II secretion system protein GspG C-terminal domain-containing protein n=1 Tax=Candidatus Roizmanbacteria bacterium GW2011_GWA2_37_7 TaxID=1618481 RepID=A0A0G0H679_9BACT|nr:MAG: hypothetical protein US54_C0004G0017 [Candidatus Roizmanbacteria bacterium GW2011_GWA2_37_7]
MPIKKTHDGFSLIEIIVVISIITLLVGIGITSFSGFRERGRDDRRILDAELLREALDKYFTNQNGGFYPTTLDILVSDGYLDRLPADPLSELTTAYQYTPLPAWPVGCTNVDPLFCSEYQLTIDLERRGAIYIIQSDDIKGNIIP